jgi:putative transposase
MLMPCKNSIKKYTEDGVYHVYNRGVEKRDIFLDSNDYKYFLYLLKYYLTPEMEEDQTVSRQGETLPRDRGKPKFCEEIGLIAYCLMPNHFHLVIKQANKDSMSRFMKSLSTNYSMYFNRTYDRVGTLFQGPYKAVLVVEDNYLMHLVRYVHLNPVVKKLAGSLPAKEAGGWEWSSHGDYLGSRKSKWLSPDLVLSYFNEIGPLKRDRYIDFINSAHHDSNVILGGIVIEDD